MCPSDEITNPEPAPGTWYSPCGPPKKSSSSCVRWRDSVRMLTTAGDTALAISRNVAAVSGPLSGALFMGGAAIVWAEVAELKSSRDEMTSPTIVPARIRRSA